MQAAILAACNACYKPHTPIAYSPRMYPNDGRVLSNFIVHITIYGNGSQTRSFCYVMVKMMNSRIEFTGPVNIGNPDEFSILDLAKKALDWEPGIKLEEGLVKTISYFDKLLKPTCASLD